MPAGDRRAYPPAEHDPWPHDSLIEFGDRFDPDRPRFADVPLVAFRDRKVVVVRGELPDTVWAQVSGLRPENFDPELRLGVFIDPDSGDHLLYEEGDKAELDLRIRREVNPSDWLSDAVDLDDFVRRSSELVEYIRELISLGWYPIWPMGLDGFSMYDSRYTSR